MMRSRTSIVAKVHSSTSPTHPKKMLTSVNQSSSINDCICSVIALKSDSNNIEWSWAGLQVAGPACKGSVKCNPAAVPVWPVKTHDRNLSNTLWDQSRHDFLNRDIKNSDGGLCRPTIILGVFQCNRVRLLAKLKCVHTVADKTSGLNGFNTECFKTMARFKASATFWDKNVSCHF